MKSEQARFLAQMAELKRQKEEMEREVERHKLEFEKSKRDVELARLEAERVEALKAEAGSAVDNIAKSLLEGTYLKDKAKAASEKLATDGFVFLDNFWDDKLVHSVRKEAI